jgi:hypothetical protein
VTGDLADPSVDPTGTDPLDDSEDRPAPRGVPRLRLGLLLVLVLAVLASTAVLVWLLAGRRGEAADEQAAREQVMSQAESFMVRINTYGPDLLEGTEMPSYRTGVAELITPKFDADFEQNVPAAEATVAQGGLARTAEVYGTGVSSIDDDSATALVTGVFTNSYPETAGSQTRVDADPSPFRVEVQLVRTDGRWLVDDFTPVNAAEDNGSGLQDLPPVDPGSLPSTDSSSPGEGATP